MFLLQFKSALLVVLFRFDVDWIETTFCEDELTTLLVCYHRTILALHAPASPEHLVTDGTASFIIHRKRFDSEFVAE